MKPAPTTLSDWGLFNQTRPCIIAGPCAIETQQVAIRTATALSSAGVEVMRGGLWKPRTHPGCFEGVGEKGLAWLQEAKKATGIRMAVEVASPHHVEACLNYGIDLLWIGARTTANPFLVQEIASALRGVDVPVLVKNPVSADVDLWMGAFERLAAARASKTGAVLRGVSPLAKGRYRNAPAWQMAVQLRSRMGALPLFCDPSHMGGSVEYVRELSQKALDIGFDGLMIESHCCPGEALSDACQQLTPQALHEILGSLNVRRSGSDETAFSQKLAALRSEIDGVDDEILQLMAARMDLSRRIGELKKDHNIAIIQPSRWESLVERLVRQGSAVGLSESFVRAYTSAIHEESVAAQEKLSR